MYAFDVFDIEKRMGEKMNYNAYDELMHYFQYELNVYLVLAAIVLAGTVRTLLAYFQAKKVEIGRAHV